MQLFSFDFEWVVSTFRNLQMAQLSMSSYAEISVTVVTVPCEEDSTAFEGRNLNSATCDTGPSIF